MKMLKAKENIRSGNNRTKVFMGLLGAILIAVVVNLLFVNIYAEQDQVYIQTVSDLRVLSQEIAKNASEVTSGSAEAFDALSESRSDFADGWDLINNGQEEFVDTGLGILTALPAKSGEISASYPNIQLLWSDISGNADLILANKETIQSLNSTVEMVLTEIPNLQREYDEVVNALLDSDESLSTIAVAQRQAWLAERIALNLNVIVSGQNDAGLRVEQFQRDINLFLINHEALLEGDITIGVNRVTNANSRQSLERIGELFSTVETQSSTIIQAAPEIIGTTKAVNDIVSYSELLLVEATALSQFFTASSGYHIASPLLGYVLLLILLITICMYGLEVIRNSRVAEKESAEVNEKNNKAVLELLEEISSLGDGDLTVEATVGEDFTGAIADSINYAVGQLRELVSAITSVTFEVSSSTKASEKTVQYLSDASRRQTKTISDVYTSVREMGKNTSMVSDNAQKSLDVANSSVEIASGGAEVVKSTIDGMGKIRDQIQDTSKRIKRLGESSQEIGGFVALINDIADHTNTLSLNAAIQAAMAGEAGKGFGVVADEVHALAERSSDATSQIESLVNVIQRDINEAVHSMEQTTSEVVEGTKLAQRAGSALDDIERVSKELADLVDNITHAAHNQTKAASEISGSMELIQKVTSETSSGTQATSEFMDNLGGLTERLQSAVEGFSLTVNLDENDQEFEQEETYSEISVETEHSSSLNSSGNSSSNTGAAFAPRLVGA